MFRKRSLILIISMATLVLACSVYAADESVLFTSVPPDALIVLDLSGSMQWNPAGTAHPYGSSVSCTANITSCSGAGCVGGYCNASKAGCNIDCSRLAIAKRAIFSMFDDTNDNIITSSGTNTDDSSLNIRMGYMRFYGGDDTAGNYASGNCQLANPIGTRYSTIFCNNTTSCNNPGTTPATGGAGQPIATTSATSGTPLSASLNEAKLYLDVHKAADPYRTCRDKFVILITDGADTYACGGSGSEDVNDMYKRRRETVARAKALGDAGYKVFVIGFGGDMPLALKRTLNWAAYYGNTDNPLDTKSGNTAAYNIARCSCPAPPAPCPPYAVCTNAPLFPSGVTSCQTAASTSIIANIAGKSGGVGDTIANADDPATAHLSGYAFISGSADELTDALRTVISVIRSANYSFTITSVSTARIVSENNLFEASFTPLDDEPFWLGNLKKYDINPDGTVGAVVWNAGTKLNTISSRNIKTYKSGALVDFTASNILPADLGLLAGNTARRNEIVGYIRAEATCPATPPAVPAGTACNPDNWKLGDIWHSSPLVVSSPSAQFRDIFDSNNAFATFRTNNQRTSVNGKRVVVAGANDGQFHVFRTSDGAETFSFIPPNLLPKLDSMAHLSDPTILQHQFFVDGPTSVANVWLPSGAEIWTSKSSTSWRTLLVSSLGRGVGPNSQYLWSASSNCTPTSATAPYGFSAIYTAGTPNYCGYYAFDFTNTLSPQFMWRINPTAAQAPYLGDPWSKMTIGRVKIGGAEKWVGFIGGGAYDYSCATTPTAPATSTKGFFVVDLSNGNILWSYTKATNSLMDFSVAAQPYAIDADNDGFVDTVYVGDLGGNIWRFKFCRNAQGNSCGTSLWSGGLFYSASTGTRRPIYSGVNVTIDPYGSFWVYWGSGDKQCPAGTTLPGTSTALQEHFYALKDADLSSTWTPANLQTLTPGQTFSGILNGWRVQLLGAGEKVMSEPIVFGGGVYFTTFMPTTSANPCDLGGTGKLYGLNYLTAAGTLTNNATNFTLGTGIPTSPIVSLRPDGTAADMYITISGGGGIDAKTFRIKDDGSADSIKTLYFPKGSKIRYWRDRRVQ